MKSFVSFIILFRYRVYKKCVEVFKKSLRFGDFFAAQNDNSAQNQRDAEDDQTDLDRPRHESSQDEDTDYDGAAAGLFLFLFLFTVCHGQLPGRN